MTKYVFIIAFIISALFQGFILWKFDMADTSQWARQAEYVQNSNPGQFDILGAYGHPGGPIIEGVILVHDAFNVSYDGSLLIFLAIFDGLIISAVCLICFLLSKNHLWWPVVLAVLSLNRLYEYSTPPSTVASLLVVLLCVFTLFLCKKEETVKLSYLILWSLIAGLLISTRADIGGVMTLAFIISLKQKINWRQILLVLMGVILFFIASDPFMWFMPIQHIQDILYKIMYHYSDFAPTKMDFLYVLNFSSLALTGIFASGILIFLNRQDKIIFPAFFFKILIATTAVLYIVFLTAKYQASRYFLPMILIWEMFLPAAIFSLADEYYVKNKNLIKVFIIILMSFYTVGLFVHSLWMNHSYNII